KRLPPLPCCHHRGGGCGRRAWKSGRHPLHPLSPIRRTFGKLGFSGATSILFCGATMTENRGPERPRRSLVIIAVLAALAPVAVPALLINIFERKQEARNPFYRVVELNDKVDDPAVWGKNFPMQYDLYLRTVDMQRSKYGGSEAEPHSPTQADPRSVVARSKLEQDPRLKTMWAGYAFSKDYRERRGHAYMLEDQTFTQRQQFNPPGACLNCHASMVTVYNELGSG